METGWTRNKRRVFTVDKWKDERDGVYKGDMRDNKH